MADRPPSSTFCWNELMTSDVNGCGKFYGQLFGWTPQAVPMGPMTYNLFKKDGKDVGGMMQITANMGNVPPHWLAYVAVDDCDASAKRAEQLGGKICVPPTDIPNVGRFALVTDPVGATLGIIKLSPK